MDSTDRRHREQFGKRVRVLRAQRGLTQDELARRCRLHRTYVGSVERGERNVSLDAIYALAAGLDVAPGRLFDEE